MLARDEDKDKIYEELSDLIRGIRGIYHIGGDMNARLYNREEEDELEIGPYCQWKEPGYLKAVDTHGKTICKEGTLESRTNSP